MDNKIIWEKWIDPFGENIEETKWNNYDDDNMDQSTELFNDHINQNMEKPVKVIASPLGLIPYNEYTASSKIFNFWIGHTNFNISQQISKIIEETEGVELLDIFTRYRFRIAIGKCFNDNNIMTNISDNIYIFLEQTYGTIS